MTIPPPPANGLYSSPFVSLTASLTPLTMSWETRQGNGFDVLRLLWSEFGKARSVI